jgi:hypothetical protein
VLSKDVSYGISNCSMHALFHMFQMTRIQWYFQISVMRISEVDENEIVPPSYDPMCATLSKGCYPVLIVDHAKLVDRAYGPAEGR